jgi:hypothetical protein
MERQIFSAKRGTALQTGHSTSAPSIFCKAGHSTSQTSIASKQSGAHLNSIDGISFSNQDLYLRHICFLILGPPPKPGGKIVRHYFTAAAACGETPGRSTVFVSCKVIPRLACSSGFSTFRRCAFNSRHRSLIQKLTFWVIYQCS